MILYRIKQVWWAWTGRSLTAEDRDLVDGLLTTAEGELFYRFTTNDQNHSVRVAKHLLSNQHDNRSLLKAALLHDVGKTKVGRLSVIDRSVAVAIKALLPKVSNAWGAVDILAANRFQKPSIVRSQHAAWGAEMVHAVGGDSLTVSLIKRHQDKLSECVSDEDHLLKLLQKADDLS